jgi:hypothetical protein
MSSCRNTRGQFTQCRVGGAARGRGRRAKKPKTVKITVKRGSQHDDNQAIAIFHEEREWKGKRYYDDFTFYNVGKNWVNETGWPMDPDVKPAIEKWLALYDEKGQ